MAATVVMPLMSADVAVQGVMVPAEMTSDIATIFDELMLLVVGFALVQVLIYAKVLPKFDVRSFFFPAKVAKGKAKIGSETRLKAKEESLACVDARDPLKLWDDACNGKSVLDFESFKECARALAAAQPKDAAAKLAEHLAQHGAGYAQPAALNVAVEAVAKFGGAAAAEQLVEKSGLQGNPRTSEIMIEAFALVGHEAKVLALLKDDSSARSLSVAVRGFVKSDCLEAAAGMLAAAADRGIALPPRAAGEVLKALRARGTEVLMRLLLKLGDRKVEVPVECLAALLDDCLQREDVALADLLEALAFRQEHKHFSIFEPLLKLHAKVGSPRAVELFVELQQAGLFASEGLCGNLLARCGEKQNLKFAEVLVGYLRKRSMMSLSIFKTLMKVYAMCGRYEDACDLYHQVLAEGLEPDEVMYGCLVKFAVKCGRHQLSQDLFVKTKRGDVQNYMWMIRSSGQDGDAGRAIQLLREVETSKPLDVDVALYNATLDVCVTNGKMNEACDLLREMADKGIANLVTYNTLVKGYCSAGDVRRARAVLRDMEAAGLAPDSVTYNCLLGAAVTANNYFEAWSILDEMPRTGAAVDHYTVSIMMKVAKRATCARDSSRALAVLDQARGIKVCADDVLFNTVLDALIARRDTVRLTRVLREYAASDTKVTVQTYGLLIKANSVLKKDCWSLWNDMVGVRCLTPNTITLSCMLDALVCARQTDRAMALFDEWKGQVGANTIMFATLIKGYATAGQPDRAMEMHQLLRAEGLEMNLVAYTSLIDAHARVGRMSDARALLKNMEAEGIEPNVITFSAVVKGYCVEGNLDAAFDAFQAMRARGLRPDIVIVNTLLDGCVRHSGYALADKLLDNMEAYGVEASNFTMSILIKMWGKRRQLDQAFALVRKAARGGSRCLDTQVGTCLISACFFNQSPGRALEALAEMKQWTGCGGPDAGSYSTLIAGLARKDLGREAADMVTEACRAGLGTELSEDSLQLLQRCLQRRGLEETWTSIQQQLRSSLDAGPSAAAAQHPSAGRASVAAAHEARPASKPISVAPAGSLTGGLLGRGSRGVGGADRGASDRKDGSPEDWMSARKAAADRR